MNQTKKTTIIALFLSLLILSGCGKLSQKKVDNETSLIDEKEVTTSTDKDNNQILKMVGRDDNGWNVYQSEKYGFEIKMPEYFEKDLSNSREHDDMDIFNNINIQNVDNSFVVWVIPNEKKIKKIESKKEFVDLFKNGRDSLVDRGFKNLEINNYNVFTIEEVTGIIDASVSYYLITDEYFYIFEYGIYINYDDVKNFKSEKEDCIISIMETFKKI